MKLNALISRIAPALFLAACSLPALAQARLERENHAVFVSQRNGAAELYLLDLNTRQVSQLTDTGRGHLSASIARGTRTIVYAAREGASYELFCGKMSNAWRTRRPQITSLTRLTVNPMEEYSPSVTADGTRMVFSSGDGIELMELGGGARRVLIPAGEQVNDFNPVIAPDGSQIAFVSNRSGKFEIWLYNTASGALRKLTDGASVAGGLGWSADSRQITFTTTATASKLSGIALASAASGAFRVLTDGNDFSASLSSRGDRILFTSLRDGDADLYLLEVNSGTVHRLTNTPGADDGAVFLPEPIRPSRQTP
jgi:Tol biopolymer transport system component